MLTIGPACRVVIHLNEDTAPRGTTSIWKLFRISITTALLARRSCAGTQDSVPIIEFIRRERQAAQGIIFQSEWSLWKASKLWRI